MNVFFMSKVMFFNDEKFWRIYLEDEELIDIDFCDFVKFMVLNFD